MDKRERTYDYNLACTIDDRFNLAKCTSAIVSDTWRYNYPVLPSVRGLMIDRSGSAIETQNETQTLTEKLRRTAAKLEARVVFDIFEAQVQV